MGRRFSNRRLINSRTLIIYSRLYKGGKKAAFPQSAVIYRRQESRLSTIRGDIQAAGKPPFHNPRLNAGGKKAAFPQVYTFAVAAVGGWREAVWGGGFLTAGI